MRARVFLENMTIFPRIEADLASDWLHESRGSWYAEPPLVNGSAAFACVETNFRNGKGLTAANREETVSMVS